MERLSNELPLIRYRHPLPHIDLYENELDILSSAANVAICIDSAIPGCASAILNKLNITSHRILLISESDCLGVRLDEIETIEIRRRFMATPRILLRFKVFQYVLSLKIKDEQFLDTIHQTLTRLISRKSWLPSGYVSRASVGGISRISAKVDENASRAVASTDAGLADLMSLKTFASELKDTIERLHSSSDNSEQIAYKQLLQEYGLSLGVPTASQPLSGNKIETMIDRALASSPAGIMFAHDLFCVINRALKLETVLSPSEFMSCIKSFSSNPAIGVMTIDNYTLVFRRAKFDMNEIQRLVEEMHNEFFKIEDFAKKLNVSDFRLAQSLLTQLELDTGTICRDDGGLFGDLVFYKNTYFR